MLWKIMSIFNIGKVFYVFFYYISSTFNEFIEFQTVKLN